MNNLLPTVHFSFSSLVLYAANVFDKVSLFSYCLYFLLHSLNHSIITEGQEEGKPVGMLGVP